MLVCLMSLLTLTGPSLGFADHFEIPSNKCVCIGIELTIGFEFLDNMERSRVVELSSFPLLMQTL
jgi:hypothetical protein